jgi:hypothetical protein
MAVLTGKDGALTFVNGYDQHVNSWTVEFSTDVFEDTSLGDSWRTRVVGINEWSGSYDCAMDDDSLCTVGHFAIGEAAAEVVFTYAGGGTLTGNVVITGATLNSSTSGVNTVNFTFVGTGEVTFA